jgi:uncharacterized protein YbjT (DUF2867 family)
VSRLAAVTGATGFLGQHLVSALAKDGWRVRMLARRDPVSPFWSGLTPEVVIGSLGDRNALQSLMQGADVVFHAAGLVAGPPSDLHRINVEGSRTVAMVAAAQPQTRMIQVSSLAAREPQLSAYAASKRAGEDAVRGVLGARATVVRPPAIYGPGDREGLRLFALATASPVLPVLDPSATRDRKATVGPKSCALQPAPSGTKPSLCVFRPAPCMLLRRSWHLTCGGGSGTPSLHSGRSENCHIRIGVSV